MKFSCHFLGSQEQSFCFTSRAVPPRAALHCDSLSSSKEGSSASVYGRFGAIYRHGAGPAVVLGSRSAGVRRFRFDPGLRRPGAPAPAC